MAALYIRGVLEAALKHILEVWNFFGGSYNNIGWDKLVSLFQIWKKVFLNDPSAQCSVHFIGVDSNKILI